MNEFEKQVLMNQREILYTMAKSEQFSFNEDRLNELERMTAGLITPKSEDSIKDKTNDGLSEKNEVEE